MGFFDTNANHTIYPILLWIFLLVSHYLYFKMSKTSLYLRENKRFHLSGWITWNGLFGGILFVPIYLFSSQHGVNFANWILSHFYKSEFEYFTHQKSILVNDGHLFNFHFLFNFTGLVIATIQMIPNLKMTSIAHRVLGSLYIFSMTIGCSSIVWFCKDKCYGRDLDGGFASTSSFFMMGASVMIPAYTGLYKILVNGDVKSHSEWMLRSYISAWGSYYFFRILLMVYLPFAPHYYSGYLIVVWASWVIPLMAIEHYIGAVREREYLKSEQKSE